MKHKVAKAVMAGIIACGSMFATFQTLVYGYMPAAGWLQAIYSLPVMLGVVCWYAVIVLIALALGYVAGLVLKDLREDS